MMVPAVGLKWAAPLGLAAAAALVLFTQEQWQQIVVASIAVIPAILLGVMNARQTKRDKKAEALRVATASAVEDEHRRRELVERQQSAIMDAHQGMITELQEEVVRLRSNAAADRTLLASYGLQIDEQRQRIRELEDSERALVLRVEELERGNGLLIEQVVGAGLEPVWRPAPQPGS